MRRAHANRFRPSLEALESRIVPQATRTWVSGVGDDANPGSRTAPCKTFAGAISKTDVGGEIDALDSGGFGELTITHAIIIDGAGNLAGCLVSGTNGFAVNAGPTDVVVIRGITFDGASQTGLDGIQVNGAGAVFVEDCRIESFGGIGINYQPVGGGKLFVTDTVIRNDAGGGIYIHPSAGGASAVVEHSDVEGNLFGLRADDGSQVAVTNSTVAGNTNEGLFAFSASQPASIGLQNDVVANNGTNTRTAGANASIHPLNGPSFTQPSHTIGTTPSSTTLTVTPAGGRRARLTAAITGAAGQAAGEVLFTDNGRVLGFAPLANGVATLTVSLSGGRHSLQAFYLGDSTYAASTSPAVSLRFGHGHHAARRHLPRQDAARSELAALTAELAAPF
jgi:hypothetical protein